MRSITESELRAIEETLSQKGYYLKRRPNTSPLGWNVEAEAIAQLCTELRDHSDTFFDHLACLTGIDQGPEACKMEVLYHLYSLVYERGLSLVVSIDRNRPQLPSVAQVWKSADWHEREAFDLLGIDFKGHPNLKRILLPEDWEGHPLRKDYQEAEEYQGIRIAY